MAIVCHSALRMYLIYLNHGSDTPKVSNPNKIQGGLSMRWTNDKVAVIAIDHGYGNIKTANTVTPTGIVAYDSKPTFEGNILCYEDKYYRLGEGHKEFIPDKVQDNDFIVNHFCNKIFFLLKTG